MKQQIESLLLQALNTFSSQENRQFSDIRLQIERPRDPEHGDFSSNIAMMLAKEARMAPRLFAERLIQFIPFHEDIETIQIAGPGFINFILSEQSLQKQIENIWQSDTLGVQPILPASTVVIDYSSPNLAKEMHVGHLRSTIIGDAIARILEFKGYQVIRQNHVGDWGTQFGMLIAHLEDIQKEHHENIAIGDLETFYKAAKQRFDSEPGFDERARKYVVLLQSGDPHCLSLWKMFIHLSMEHCQIIYDRLNVALKPENVMPESAYNPELTGIVNTLRNQQLLVEHEGAQCVFMDEFKGKDNEPLPVIVQKKDGGFLYASTDLAAVKYRHDILHANRILYIVDARQSLHFQQIFALSHKAGFASADLSLEHVSFGMVLDKSGKPYKSRDGGVTKLSDLLDEAEKRAYDLISEKQASAYPQEELRQMAQVIGISAVKYADLSKNRTSDYIFDWDTMISFEGNTAPYLLYAYTRVQSLFQKANINAETLCNPVRFAHPMDKALARHLILFPEMIDTVVLKTTPHLLCTWLYELAGLFSSFYEACPILNQENAELKDSRLKLAALTAQILEKGLKLLGITTLRRM